MFSRVFGSVVIVGIYILKHLRFEICLLARPFLPIPSRVGDVFIHLLQCVSCFRVVLLHEGLEMDVLLHLFLRFHDVRLFCAHDLVCKLGLVHLEELDVVRMPLLLVVHEFVHHLLLALGVHVIEDG